jgi:hypothetical protein
MVPPIPLTITSGKQKEKKFLTAAGDRNSELVHPQQCKKTNVLVIAKYAFAFGLATVLVLPALRTKRALAFA